MVPFVEYIFQFHGESPNLNSKLLITGGDPQQGFRILQLGRVFIYISTRSKAAKSLVEMLYISMLSVIFDASHSMHILLYLLFNEFI